MVITDKKIKEALRLDVKPYEETKRMLLEQLDAGASESENRKMNTSIAYRERSAGRNGLAVLAGILAMAAVVVIAVILMKLLPSLRSPLADDPGPESDGSQILVTGETEDTDEEDRIDEVSENTEDSGETKEEDTIFTKDGVTYRTRYFSFTLPELWRDPDVKVNGKENESDGELSVTYRGLKLCEFFVGQKDDFVNENGGDPGYYLAKSWDLADGSCAALLLSNWAWVICAQGFISPIDFNDLSQAEYTSDEDLSDILHIVTGKDLDAAIVRGKFSDISAADDVWEVINASQEFINDELIPAVKIIGDDSAYRYQLDTMVFTVPELWRDPEITIREDENELAVMWRDLTLCQFWRAETQDDLFGGDPLHYLAETWDLGNGYTIELWANNWPRFIRDGSVSTANDVFAAEGQELIEYTSPEDLADLLYITTGGKEFDIDEYLDQSGNGAVLTEAIGAGIGFIHKVVATSFRPLAKQEFEMDSFSFTLPEFWADQGVTVTESEDSLNVMYWDIRLCTITAVTEEFITGDDPSRYLAESWDLGNGKRLELVIDDRMMNITTQGSITVLNHISGGTDDMTYTNVYNSDEDLSKIAYILTGQDLDITTIRGQSSNPAAEEDVAAAMDAARAFIFDEVVPGITVK